MQSPVKVWRNQKKIKKILGIEGEILTFTKVFVPPQGFLAQAPYIVVVVKLKTGIRYTSQLVDFDENQIKAGTKVVTVLRRIRDIDEEGVIPYGVKFKPI